MAKAMDAGQGAESNGPPAPGEPTKAERDTRPMVRWADPAAARAVDRIAGYGLVGRAATAVGARTQDVDTPPARPRPGALPPGFRMIPGHGPVLGGRPRESDPAERAEPAESAEPAPRESDASSEPGELPPLLHKVPEGVRPVIGRSSMERYAPQSRPEGIETHDGVVRSPAARRRGGYEPDLIRGAGDTDAGRKEGDSDGGRRQGS
jgi:hypothetical protein